MICYQYSGKNKRMKVGDCLVTLGLSHNTRSQRIQVFQITSITIYRFWFYHKNSIRTTTLKGRDLTFLLSQVKEVSF